MTTDTTARSASAEPTGSARTTSDNGPAPRTRSATRRLIASELRLFGRDPLTLTFVLIFPIVTMLIIGGSFGTSADDVFPVNPSHWYVASYFTVVIGATGLIMLPVHIASYRERGVLRRLTVAGFPRWSFGLAQLMVGLTAIAVSGVALLAVAAPVYGIPEVHSVARLIAGVVVGSVTFVAIGVVLGTLLPSARAAQAIGLLLFFPSFLLGVGGPPPAVMSPALRAIAGKLPLALANDAIRDPWLGLGNSIGALIAVSAIGTVAVAVAARRTTL